MKMIDKALQTSTYTKEEIIKWCCPSTYGFKDMEECSRTQDCEKCWNREVEE